jgi:hypothetical protein
MVVWLVAGENSGKEGYYPNWIINRKAEIPEERHTDFQQYPD